MTATKTVPEDLWAAAARVREVAAKVPQGHDDDHADWAGKPWRVEECEDDCACIVYQGDYVEDFRKAQVPHIQYVADAESPGHATWIALMDPEKGDLLADLLDDQAGAFEVWAAKEGADIAERIVLPALRLARAINAASSSGRQR